MSNLYSKNFDDADEVKTPPKARGRYCKIRKYQCIKISSSTRLGMVRMYQANSWGA